MTEDAFASPLLTLKETAAYLRVCPTTIYRQARKGKIPGALKVGSAWRFHKDRIDAWAVKVMEDGE